MQRFSLGWITQTVVRHGATIDSILTENDLFIKQIEGKFDTLWFDDHFHKDDNPILETWTTLTYLSAKYPNFKFGTSVLCQSFRNPALLAKMSATLQYLTNGRLILGIGAGWKEDEFLAYNYEFAEPKIRLEQLEDTAQILKSMWQHSPSTYIGKHHKILNAQSQPLPNPPPPLLIGGGGEKTTLKIVAKYADWMNITHIPPEDYAHKLEVLKQHCMDVGRDYDQITKSVWVYINLAPAGTDPDEYGDDRYMLAGAPDDILNGLRRFIDAGAQHLMLRFVDFPSDRGLNLFLNEIYPKLG
jgi:alkanesulfonate monooxygenase SsuD/methylene tetrahydromethanopterin reductase-like flavin-dependent oxidoreductase (luciferase family)